MNVIGERISIAGSRDPTKVGRTGTVLLETAKTLIVQTARGKIRVEKKGTVLVVSRTETVVVCDDILGRPEDRLKGNGR